MSDVKFKTMRHIETVRNYLNAVVIELLHRQEQHDQSKFSNEEMPHYARIHDELQKHPYGSEEYKALLKSIKPAIHHHHMHAKHHPEFWDGYQNMTLIDLIEMVVDWKCASMRSKDGDLRRSIEIGQERFGYSDELKKILMNTAEWIETLEVYHKAEESA